MSSERDRRYSDSKDDDIKLFVYGVHRSCPKSILEDEFRRYGEVTDVFITEKGYAFVTMGGSHAKEEAEKAIEELHGTVMDGQEVKVEMSHGKGKPRGGGSRDDHRDDRRGGFGPDRRRDNRYGGRRSDGGYGRDRGGDRRRDYGGGGGRSGGYGDRDRRRDR